MKYLIWLVETAKIPADKCVRLLGHYGSGEAVYRANPEAAARECGLSADEAKGLATKSLKRTEGVLGDCKKQNVRIMTIFDDDYPHRLKNIFDPPPILYLRGRLPDFNSLPAISVVGQREATPYGLAAAEKLGYQLSMAGFVVVSGMARGVDGASHKGALKGRTPTVAVFGTAIDECYPKENLPLSRQILQSGAVISEYPPGTRGRPWFFPMRNRIISGLSLGTVVVEAGAKSGSLITANLALDQGHDVFAVPGPINAASSIGTNDLIKKGAKLISDVNDIIAEYAPLYGLSEAHREPLPRHRAAPAAAQPQTVRAVFERDKPMPVPTGDPVLDAIGGAAHIDEIIEKTGVAQHELLARLTVLELEGKIRQLPGKHFERI